MKKRVSIEINCQAANIDNNGRLTGNAFKWKFLDGMHVYCSNSWEVRAEDMQKLGVPGLVDTVDLQDKKIYRYPRLDLPRQKVDLLKEEYTLNKDYTTLKMLLEQQWKTKQYLELLKHSEDGISLFPAQPFLYLMNGRALNSLRKNSEALSVMEEGLDYIIEDDQLKSAFYEEMSLSYKASGNNKMATEYYNRAMELKDE